MHPVEKHLFDTNFKDITGAQLEGTIALSDEIINLGFGELLGQLNATANTSSKTGASPKTESPVATPDPQAMLQLLNIQQLKYRTETGKTILEIKVNLRSGS